MATARTPQDRKSPAQAEVEGGTESITFRDKTFAAPANLDDVDGEFLKYAADGDGYRMVEAVLDAKQFAQLRAMKPTVGDYKAIGRQVSSLYGFDSAGE